MWDWPRLRAWVTSNLSEPSSAAKFDAATAAGRRPQFGWPYWVVTDQLDWLAKFWFRNYLIIYQTWRWLELTLHKFQTNSPWWEATRPTGSAAFPARVSLRLTNGFGVELNDCFMSSLRTVYDKLEPAVSIGGRHIYCGEIGARWWPTN